jgi:hypothetical protein
MSKNALWELSGRIGLTAYRKKRRKMVSIECNPIDTRIFIEGGHKLWH